MTNDTSVSRVATDSTQSVYRRRSNNDSIEISQLSFFDELLSIGQFESTLPEPSGLPAQPAPAESTSQGNPEPSDRDKKDSREDSDRPGEPTPSQQAIAVQPLQPAPNLARGQTTAKADSDSSRLHGEDSKVLVKAESKVAKEKDAKPIGPEKSTAAATSLEATNVPIADTETTVASNAVAPADKKVAKETAEGINESISRVHTARQSSSSTDTNPKDGSDHNEQLDPRPRQREAKDNSITRISNLEPANTESNARDAGNANDVIPRNKRAERLAKQASEPDSEPSDLNATKDPNPLLDASSLSTQLDKNSSEETLSLSSPPQGTTPTGASPIVSIPPISAMSFTISSGGTGEGNRSRAVVEGSSSSAASAIRGTSTTSSVGSPVPSNGTSQGRADQARTEVARSNPGSQISAYQETKLVQRVLRGVEQLANGGGQVRLRLHPPELGSLQMSLRMEAGQVFAKLEVENATARDALLNNVQILRDRMAEQGMKVAAFEVEVSTDSSGSGIANSQSQNSGGSGGESRWENATSRFAAQNSNRLSNEPASPERKNAPTWTRTNGSLDLMV